MNFDFKEEQLQFADALRRWVGRDYDFEKRRAVVRSESGTDDGAWATLAELGMTALPVPEEHGGFGGNAVDMFVVMQELGRGLVVEPYLATMLGAQRTTVNEAAQALQAAGAIAYSRGKLTILNRATLERAACECYRATGVGQEPDMGEA